MFVLTESFVESRDRISLELFGTPADLDIPGDFGDLKARILSNLEEANRRFTDAASQKFDTPTEVASRWVVQESHLQQRRPVLTLGGEARCFYKPRSMHADIEWNNLVSWYSDAVADHVSEPLEISSRVDSGWVSVVEPKPCEPDEVEKFYHRLGLLGALLWAVGGTDATATNIIAAGSHPTLIDAEMVLVPAHSVREAPLATEFRRGGIAPFMAADRDGRQVSLGAAALHGVSCAHWKPRWPTLMACPLCHNVPRTASELCFANVFVGSLSRGFSNGVRAITAKRKELLAYSSPLNGFETAPGRVVLRPSAGYAAVRSWMFAKRRDSGKWPSVASLLRKLPLKENTSSVSRETLISAELRSLFDGDVPRFQMLMSDRRLMCDGKTVATFRYSAFDRARQRILTLDQRTANRAALEWNSYVELAQHPFAGQGT